MTTVQIIRYPSSLSFHQLLERVESHSTCWSIWKKNQICYLALDAHMSIQASQQSEYQDFIKQSVTKLQHIIDQSEHLTCDQIKKTKALPWIIGSLRFDIQRPYHETQDKTWQAWGEYAWCYIPKYFITMSPQVDTSTPHPYMLEIAYITQEPHSYLAFEDSVLGQILQTQDFYPTPHPHISSLSTDIDANIIDEDVSQWTPRAQHAIQRIQSADHEIKLNKVVLARKRSVQLPEGHAWSIAYTWQALTTHTLNTTPFAHRPPNSTGVFMGNTPETLIYFDQENLVTHALAGTRSRSKNKQEDDRYAHDLFSSHKENEEHQYVVDMIYRSLSPYTNQITTLPRSIRKLDQLQHLETVIQAQLKDDIDATDLIFKLHPTPALAGTPQKEAMTYLRHYEDWDRGAYAAPWFSMNLQRQGQAWVGIRSLYIDQDCCDLFAGAGIVASSDPVQEWHEINSKFDNAYHSLRVIKNAVRVQPNTHTSTKTSHPSQCHQYSPQAHLPLAKQVDLQHAQFHTHALQQWYHAYLFLHTCKQLGVMGMVISPGSRNTPVVLAGTALFDYRIAVDERSAAFMALGWARSAQAPIILSCTSGSAAAHYLPALIEACHSATPIIILTADRPPSLMNKGSLQTIKQVGMFAHHVKDSISLPLPTKSQIQSTSDTLTQWYQAAMIGHSVSTSYPMAPIHINMPFEEPLWSSELEQILVDLHVEKKDQLSPSLIFPPQLLAVQLPNQGHIPQLPHTHKTTLEMLSMVPQSPMMRRVYQKVYLEPECLIYCGPLSFQESQHILPHLLEFLTHKPCPVVLEAASHLRGHPELHEYELSHFDAYCRAILRISDHTTRMTEQIPAPKLLIHIGTHTHSRAIRSYLKSYTSQSVHIFVGGYPDPANPLDLPGFWIDLYSPHALQHLNHYQAKDSAVISRSYLKQWQKVQRTLHQCHQQQVSNFSQLSALSLGLHLNQTLQLRLENKPSAKPVHLYVASSMSFRDVDATQHGHPIQVWSSRGTNGIDGTLSTALGVMQNIPLDHPLIIWLGDLAAFHDLQGWAMWGQSKRQQRRTAPTLILLANNAEGGIFKHLPIRDSKFFSPYFSTPQVIAWKSVMETWGIPYTKVITNESLKHVLTENLIELQPTSSSANNTLHHLLVLDIRFDATLDYHHHLDYWKAFEQSLLTIATGDQS